MASNVVTIGLREGADGTFSAAIYQYDYGQRILFTGVELPDAYEVHFSNTNLGASKTRIGTADGCEIPNEFLITGQPLHVWVFLHSGANDGETVYSAVVPVVMRARPDVEDIPPEQESVISETIAALNTGVAAAQAAQTAAETAQSAAEDAQTAAETAAESAGSATAAAEQAAAAATESADAASASATSAAGSASASAGSATAAAASASAAATSASAAATAQTAAETAAESAGSAQTAAETAQSAAEDAQAAAETAAEQAASELSELRSTKAGIIRDSASGAVASFIPDATVPNLLGLTLDIEPVQDLHGYDTPWPAGGGVNLLDISALTPQSSTLSFSDNKVTITAWTTKGYNGAIYDANHLVGGGDYYLSFHALRSSGSMNDVAIVGSYVLDGVTYNAIKGTRVYVDDEITATDLVVNFPSGATAARFVFYINNSITVIDGMNGYFENIILSKSPNQTWTPYSNICPISGWTEANVVVSPTQNAEDGVTYSMDWTDAAGTVYGGTLDAVTGILTVKKYMDFALWGDLQAAGSYSETERRRMAFSFPGGIGAARANSISNVAPYLNSTADAVHYQIGAGGLHADFYLPIGTSDTMPVQLVYELAAPIVYALDHAAVKTLLGTNNIWADTGDTELTYRADPTLYIERKIAAAMAAASEA